MTVQGYYCESQGEVSMWGVRREAEEAERARKRDENRKEDQERERERVFT